MPYHKLRISENITTLCARGLCACVYLVSLYCTLHYFNYFIFALACYVRSYIQLADGSSYDRMKLANSGVSRGVLRVLEHPPCL